MGHLGIVESASGRIENVIHEIASCRSRRTSLRRCFYRRFLRRDCPWRGSRIVIVPWRRRVDGFFGGCLVVRKRRQSHIVQLSCICCVKVSKVSRVANGGKVNTFNVGMIQRGIAIHCCHCRHEGLSWLRLLMWRCEL